MDGTMEDERQEELGERHRYLPWALEVQGALAGLAYHHHPGREWWRL